MAFTDFFVRDEDSPQYTACAAVLLYKALQECRLIPRDDDTYDSCVRYEYDVPQGYSFSIGTGHCFHRSYRYRGYGSFGDDFWTKKLCDTAMDASSPDVVKDNLKYSVVGCLANQGKGSQKSTKV